MERTPGNPDINIGLIDGAVATGHPDLLQQRLREVSVSAGATCVQIGSAACLHGTFVAGILAARRGSPAPAICPGCTLLIRPVFAETGSGREQVPSATPQELAMAIIDCVDAGARIINLSLALDQPSAGGQKALDDAFEHAVRRGVIVVAAAGNQGAMGSSAITRHPWIIPVAGCCLRGWPMNELNLGGSIGRRGLSAPGEGVTSLGSQGQPHTIRGTSVAAPFVAGAIALLWSLFPAASAAQIKLAVTNAWTVRRAAVVPPLLNAEAAYQTLVQTNSRR